MRLPAAFTTLIWPLAMFAMPAAAIAAECSAHSGAQSVPLLELYTSEGCSSCPPADKWLSSIAGSGFGANKVVRWHFMWITGITSAGKIASPSQCLPRDNMK